MYVATNISEAAIFSVLDEQLESSTNEVAFANPDDLKENFSGPILIALKPTGPSTVFSIAVGTNKLIWANERFKRGKVAFCVDSDQIINGVYTGSFDPLCHEVELTAELQVTSSSATPSTTITSSKCTAISVNVNHIQNPGFESGGFAPWKPTVNGGSTAEYSISKVKPMSGKSSFFVQLTATSHSSVALAQTISTCPKRMYKGAVWVNISIEGGESNGCALVILINGVAVTINHQDTAGSYTQVPFNFTAATGSTKLEVLSICTDGVFGSGVEGKAHGDWIAPNTHNHHELTRPDDNGKEEGGEGEEEGERGILAEIWHFIQMLGDILERFFVLVMGD
ncbi:hypothetical protein AA313_de0204694 [Arthrobotrys entomopaga]|nr:hypothetical protein AA313_de0204694 [Arthrobotrys entomopaga]